MKKYARVVYMLASSLALAATFIVGTNSVLFVNSPDVPEELMK
ncbi:hypothetical protein [Paenibacillus rhizophilus]|nr:hypothetical protein [Paenibacillus rhizophilus]